MLTTALAAAAVAVPTAAAAAPAHPRPAPHKIHHVAASVPGTFVPVGQFRAFPAGRALAAGQSTTVTVAGRHGVPVNAAAAVVTVHAIAPTSTGVLTVFPAGTKRPSTNSVVFERGRGASEGSVVRLGHGALAIANRAPSGHVRVAVDVAGYIAGGPVNRSDPGLTHLLPAPVRVLDTRPKHMALRGGGTRTVSMGHGVPTTGVGAVGVMLTAVDPARRGSLVAYAVGNDQPTAAATTFGAGHSASAFAWVPTKGDGRITVANTSAGPTNVALDVMAWTNAGVAQVAGAVQPRFPAGLVDDRTVAANHTLTVPVAGRGGVPLAGVRAAIVSVSTTGASRPGALAVWPGGAVPRTRALQYVPGLPAGTLTEVPLVQGSIHVRNVAPEPVRVSVSVSGFVPSVRRTPPASSVSRYLGDLTENIAQDTAVMDTHGCTDAQAMAGTPHAVVLLDTGAQSVTDPELSPADPGVTLTQTSGASAVRLRYPDLVTVLDSYLSGFARCADGTAATIAIGTNNDGAWDPNGANYYAPADRGADWAGSVLNMLGSQPRITLVAANDIEAGFNAGTQAQAQTWEDSYFGAAITSREHLIYNGSADGCPDGFGQVRQACATGWTQRGIYNLAHSGSTISVLPQIYGPSEAAQWANIDRTGGGGLVFAGVLTQHQLDASSYTPASGWAALTYAIGTLTTSRAVPAVTDVRNG